MMMPTTTDDYDDFFDELPTAVMIKRLIDEAIAEARGELDEQLEDELDPAEFVAIGTR
jgi:hypothetical protein